MGAGAVFGDKPLFCAIRLSSCRMNGLFSKLVSGLPVPEGTEEGLIPLDIVGFDVNKGASSLESLSQSSEFAVGACMVAKLSLACRGSSVWPVELGRSRPLVEGVLTAGKGRLTSSVSA